ncbi:MAG: hypothetical protein U5L96_20480 [Owenweeksia sp.]|nr:hypothetical protein [Owenweeksia sp.]
MKTVNYTLRSYYKAGQQQGPYVSYFEDGSLRAKGEMIDGKKEGEWLIARGW